MYLIIVYGTVVNKEIYFLMNEFLGYFIVQHCSATIRGTLRQFKLDNNFD